MMQVFPLPRTRFVVVEDEYLAASTMVELEDADAAITGPLWSVAEAVELLAEDIYQVAAAILDVDPKSDVVCPSARTLVGRKLPFVFLTAYDRASLSEDNGPRQSLRKRYP